MKKRSKSSFARELGVSRNTVHSWCENSFSPNAEHAKEIARILNVPDDQLWQDTNPYFVITETNAGKNDRKVSN